MEPVMSESQLPSGPFVAEAWHISQRIRTAKSAATIRRRLNNLATTENDVLFVSDDLTLSRYMVHKEDEFTPLFTLAPFPKLKAELLKIAAAFEPDSELRTPALSCFKYVYEWTNRVFAEVDDDIWDWLDPALADELEAVDPAPLKDSWPYARQTRLVMPSSCTGVYTTSSTAYAIEDANRLLATFMDWSVCKKTAWGAISFFAWPKANQARHDRLLTLVDQAASKKVAGNAEEAFAYIRESAAFRESELEAHKTVATEFGVEFGVAPRLAIAYWKKHNLVPERAMKASPSAWRDRDKSIKSTISQRAKVYKDSAWFEASTRDPKK
jgi:hypothetical protein